MKLHHLEWLVREPVPDPEAIRYEVLPYSPTDADRIIKYLCTLARFDLRQAGHDPARAQQIREAFRFIVEAACERQALLDLNAIERVVGKPPWCSGPQL